MVEYIKKRDGRIIKFNDDRITRAIFLAASEAAKNEGVAPSYQIAEEITQDVIKILNSKYGDTIPGVEDVQDVVVKVLIEGGHAKLAKNILLIETKEAELEILEQD